MPLEYEYQVYAFDKANVIRSIKKLGFKKKGRFIFRVIVFKHPLNIPDTYIRIRDEGHRTTLTYKSKNPRSKFENEDEVLIDNFDNGVTILLNLGCQKKYYYEKIREIWSLDNDEIVFDINPGEPERMEIESHTKKDLDTLTEHLELSDAIVSDDYDPFKELFGFELDTTVDLTFLTVKKTLGKLVTKNKPAFKKLIEDQIEIYNEVLEAKHTKSP